MSTAMELQSATFANKVLQADKPVLVDFWATWCGPCRMMAPVVEALSQEYAGRVDVYKVNVDDCGDLGGSISARTTSAAMRPAISSTNAARSTLCMVLRLLK